MRYGLLAGLLLVSGGCLSAPETRMPEIWPRHPVPEVLRFHAHDPFADQRLGPDTHTRPRDMDRPRSLARQMMEQQAAHGSALGRSRTVPTRPPPRPFGQP